jgi:hypothetical protein
MKSTSRSLLLVVFTLFFASAAYAGAFEDYDRTSNRSVLGGYPLPDWITQKPEHYEFSPLVSNDDPLTQHPAAWDGQGWDPKKWGPGWTPEIAIQKFFNARIFEHQYMYGGRTPVVELGPTFYKLSPLDQRRTLKLLTDQAGIFKKGHDVVELTDWHTHGVVGTYTPKGLFLN